MRIRKYSNRVIVFSILFGFFTVCGCAKIPLKREVPTKPLTPDMIRANKMLSEAELFIQTGEYQKALRIYDDFLSQSPTSPVADRVMMQKGNIHMQTGNYAGARNAYQGLIFDYPRSPFADKAKFNIAFAYYKENKYQETILYAKSLLSLKPLSPRQKVRLIILIGDSLLGQKKVSDAVVSYVEAYQLAQEDVKERLLDKLKPAIADLTEPEIRILVRQYKKDMPSGYLLFQQAKLYEQQGLEARALEILAEFLRDFPKHELAGAAQEMSERFRESFDIDKQAIGCILPLTGPYEQFGNRVLSGIELALAEFNSTPGITPVRMVIKDSRGDPEVARRVLDDLVHNERVIGIIGPMITSEYVAEAAQNMCVPLITLTQKEDITKTGNFVFRNFLTPVQQIKMLVPYVVNTLGCKKFAILYPEDSYGIRFMNLFWDELILHGGQVVGIESYQSNQTDFAAHIKKLVGLFYERIEPIEEVDSDEITEEQIEIIEDELEDEEAMVEEPKGPEPIIDFDAIFIPDTSKNISLIAPQLMYNDVSGVALVGTNLWHSSWLLEQSVGYVQGAIFPSGFFVDDSNPSVQEFVNNFQGTFGRKPTFLDAQGYDVAKLISRLVNKPTVCTRNALRVALHQIRGFPTVTGFISFDENGNANKELALLKIEGRRFIQIH